MRFFSKKQFKKQLKNGKRGKKGSFFEKSRKNVLFFQYSVGSEKALAEIETEQVKKLCNHRYIKQEFLKEIRYEAQEEIINPNPDDPLG